MVSTKTKSKDVKSSRIKKSEPKVKKIVLVCNETPTPKDDQEQKVAKVKVEQTKNEKIKKEKKFDPAKTNAVQVLQRIAFTHVEDRMLMNSDDIEKHEVTKKFLGYDNPTTCQLNLNFLYCKAISALERRLASVEKQLKALLFPNASANGGDTSVNVNVSGKKRKREVSKEDEAVASGSKDVNVNSDVDAGNSNITFQGEGVKTENVEIIDLDGGETKAC